MSLAALAISKQESISDRIHSAIREAIYSGQLKTGQRLTETGLARQFDVSRASLREALQRLAYEGLVELNSYKGARVVELTPERLNELIALRLLLEGEAVRQAKRRMTENDRQSLVAIARKMRSPQTSGKAYPDFDLELHQKLWEISANQTLQRHLHLLVPPLFAMGTILRYSEARRERGAGQEASADHQSLVEGICDGSEEQAVDLIRSHVRDSWKVTRSRLELFVKQKQ